MQDLSKSLKTQSMVYEPLQTLWECRKMWHIYHIKVAKTNANPQNKETIFQEWDLKEKNMALIQCASREGKENHRRNAQPKRNTAKRNQNAERTTQIYTENPKNLQFGSTCKDEKGLEAQHSKAMSIHQCPEESLWWSVRRNTLSKGPSCQVQPQSFD